MVGNSNNWFTTHTNNQTKRKLQLHPTNKVHQPNSNANASTRSFAGHHELLINALFADAKHRQEQRNRKSDASTPASVSSPVQASGATVRRTRSFMFSSTRKRTKSDVQSQHKGITTKTKTKTTSTYHSRAMTTIASRMGVEMLLQSTIPSEYADTDTASKSTPKHKSEQSGTSSFKKKISKSPLLVLKRFKNRRKLKRKRRRTEKKLAPGPDGSDIKQQHTSTSFYIPIISIQNSFSFHRNKSNIRDSDTETNTDTETDANTETTRSFLHEKCRLQKDSGKGIEPGKSIHANGSQRTMEKLVEKMDLLGEMEPGGRFAHATLVRAPASDMAMSTCRTPRAMTKSPSAGEGLAETRSMVTVKMGFVTIRYGFLIHWNTSSGLAELIVLRKKCLHTFMKATKVKAKTKAPLLVKSKSKLKPKSMRAGSANTHESKSESPTNTQTTSNGKTWKKRKRRLLSMSMNRMSVLSSHKMNEQVNIRREAGTGTSTIQTMNSADSIANNNNFGPMGSKLMRSRF